MKEVMGRAGLEKATSVKSQKQVPSKGKPGAVASSPMSQITKGRSSNHQAQNKVAPGTHKSGPKAGVLLSKYRTKKNNDLNKVLDEEQKTFRMANKKSTL